MFQPQPTPFAPSSFVSYGLASDLDFAFPVSAGGGFYNSPAPAPAPATSQQLPQSHSQSHPTLQSQSQSQPHLIQQQVSRQQLPSSAVAPSASPPHSSPQTSNSKSSSSPTLAQPQSRQRLPHQQLNILSRQQPAQQQQYATQSGLALLKMDDGLHDLAAQQAAAQDYQAELEGLAVGNKTSSEAITQEYAKADPVYVEKTIALPQTFTHYRPIIGDGNCGWRAIGFSYFEKLVESGDQAKIEGEVARLMSMNHLLATVGNYQYYEDWADEMLDLLREVAQNMNNPHLAQVLIQEKWNDRSVADSLIYYLRLLAGTYLKANAATFDPFITEYNGVQGYCSQCIDIPNREIEHLGIEALSNVLLKPVDFVLEIAYLDRSPGARVNTHRFPGETNGQDVNSLGTVIYLLFRPGHYDILYKGDTMQVFRVNGFTHNTNITTDQADLGQYTTMSFDALSIIPGFSNSASLGGLGQIAPPPGNSMSESFSPVQQSPWMSSFPESLPSSTQRIIPPQPQPIMASPQPPTPPASISSSSAIAPSPAMGSASGPGPQSSLPLRTASSYHIRFSPVQLDYDESKNNFPESTFQVTTNTFKNSIWNRAHYCNPNFHPEEWSPDDEHTDGRVGGKRKLKKEIS
ncbi:uncharacterized protein FTOL_04695 [Fusarium torulosum]|uniref:ubiquitinyl hydrolase 1 n=1 Tax=Fusarium torulosum TaxID=33205 RepID=A0AAE8M6D3_9HYPO|nr:uncharacterized protein FTOL_04695 [Fusarium torulosum]